MRIVFRMPGYKGNALIFAGKQVCIPIFRFGQDLQIGDSEAQQYYPVAQFAAKHGIR